MTKAKESRTATVEFTTPEQYVDHMRSIALAAAALRLSDAETYDQTIGDVQDTLLNLEAGFESLKYGLGDDRKGQGLGKTGAYEDASSREPMDKDQDDSMGWYNVMDEIGGILYGDYEVDGDNLVWATDADDGSHKKGDVIRLKAGVKPKAKTTGKHGASGEPRLPEPADVEPTSPDQLTDDRQAELLGLAFGKKPVESWAPNKLSDFFEQLQSDTAIFDTTAARTDVKLDDARKGEILEALRGEGSLSTDGLRRIVKGIISNNVYVGKSQRDAMLKTVNSGYSMGMTFAVNRERLTSEFINALPSGIEPSRRYKITGIESKTGWVHVEPLDIEPEQDNADATPCQLALNLNMASGLIKKGAIVRGTEDAAADGALS